MVAPPVQDFGGGCRVGALWGKSVRFQVGGRRKSAYYILVVQVDDILIGESEACALEVGKF